MNGKTLKVAGVIAGVVVLLGILAIGAQYISGLSGGASAQVTKLELLPPTITISKETYTTLLSQLDAYRAAHDLATKNQIMEGIRSLVEDMAK